MMMEALNTDANRDASAAPGTIVLCNSEDEYYAALEAAGDRLVVVDCFAVWCTPCQQISAVFCDLASQYPNVVFIKVDMDKVSAQLKTVLGVWALPTFCFFRYGKKVGSFMGANERLLIKGLEHNGEPFFLGGMHGRGKEASYWWSPQPLVKTISSSYYQEQF